MGSNRRLYAVLVRLTPSPVGELNRAVAVGRAYGPSFGLELVQRLVDSSTLDAYAMLHAAHADLLEQCGDIAAASNAWARSIQTAPNDTVRRPLQ